MDAGDRRLRQMRQVHLILGNVGRVLRQRLTRQHRRQRRRRWVGRPRRQGSGAANEHADARPQLLDLGVPKTHAATIGPDRPRRQRYRPVPSRLAPPREQRVKRLADNLWSEPKGRPWAYPAVYDLVGRLRERTGIDFGPHQYRHTYATWLLRRGAGMESVKELGTRLDQHDVGHVWPPDRRRRPSDARSGGLVLGAGGAAVNALVDPAGSRSGLLLEKLMAAVRRSSGCRSMFPPRATPLWAWPNARWAAATAWHQPSGGCATHTPFGGASGADPSWPVHDLSLRSLRC